MQNIQEFLDKCKGHVYEGVGECGLIMVVFLVGIASFGLGRLSALETARPPVSITQAPELASPRAMYLGGLLVAAKTGHSYYFPWCAGMDKISPENQVWFKDEVAAQKAGYTPAKNCKGLVTP